MEITSVKILQKEVTITADDGKGEVVYTRKAEPHNDFTATMEGLTDHLRNIFEEPKDVNIHVNGFALFGAGESLAVIIKGQKILSTDKTGTINTPKTTLKGGDYEHERKLYKALMKVVDQAAQYLNGKINPTPIETAIQQNTEQ